MRSLPVSVRLHRVLGGVKRGHRPGALTGHRPRFLGEGWRSPESFTGGRALGGGWGLKNDARTHWYQERETNTQLLPQPMLIMKNISNKMGSWWKNIRFFRGWGWRLGRCAFSAFRVDFGGGWVSGGHSVFPNCHDLSL